MKEFWNERYSQEEYFYGTQPNVFLSHVAGIIAHKGRALCLAEGEGRNAVFLASLGLQVDAVDYSVTAQQKALALARSSGVHLNYDVADLYDYPFRENHYDAVVSIFCHLPHSLRSQVKEKIQSSLKVGGFYLVQSYHRKQLEYKTGGPQDVDMLVTAQILREDFPRLNWIKLDEHEALIHEGIGHTGLSFVVSGVGQKCV